MSMSLRNVKQNANLPRKPSKNREMTENRRLTNTAGFWVIVEHIVSYHDQLIITKDYQKIS